MQESDIATCQYTVRPNMMAEDHSGVASDQLPTQPHVLARRAQVAAEILATEQSYVDGLDLIEKLYIAPLLASAQQQAPILSRKEVRQLFANFPDIITLSRELLSQLEARLGPSVHPPWDPATGRIGDIFMRIAPFLKVYSLYLRNFRSALADISGWLSGNREFALFVRRANASPECKGLSFQSYLLLPVQRIPRYKLLLGDLLKHTPQTHVDHASIRSALQAIEEVAAFVDENIEEHEMALSIIEIQRTLGLKESLLIPGRRLIKTGALTKICRKNHQQRWFYLFSDILLYSSGPVPLIDDQLGHRRVPLEDCKVMDVPDAADCCNQLTIISREKSFIVYTETASEKAGWLAALSRAILKQRSARETLQMDRSLKRRIVQARRSTMMHFPRVAENFDAPVWDPDESSNRCYICFRDFTLFMRRHHCRACGKIVCNSCSRKNIVFVDPASAETKEGRGCDQCIARMFGREALESPPGTIHKFLSRSRHSLDPGTLIQSLSALKTGAGSTRNLPVVGLPSAPWGEDLRRSSIGGRGHSSSFGAVLPPGGKLGENIPLPAMTRPRCQHGADCGCGVMQRQQYSAASPGVKSVPDSAVQVSDFPSRPATPVLASAASNECSISVSDPPMLMPSSPSKAAHPEHVHPRSMVKHLSTGSALEWDSLPVSARTTFLYEAPSPTAFLTGTSSPMSTISHHRVSLVSSTCSTIAPDSPLRPGQSRTRRPIAFAPHDSIWAEAARGASCAPPTSSASHRSLAALRDGTASAMSGSQLSLVSPAAPPKLTLVQAEAVALRHSKATNATLCSLCHGDFTAQGSQHQCSSCLLLVCSRCIRRQPAISQPQPGLADFAHTLSMYIPDGHVPTPGGLVCAPCAASSGHIDNRHTSAAGNTPLRNPYGQKSLPRQPSSCDPGPGQP
ncbi:hypothetical protein GGF46_002357 [Coemansia sp. RSA 552]|nr:hypothetical protein GGF46_002357 [Coemansia sp. RSA 552]